MTKRGTQIENTSLLHYQPKAQHGGLRQNLLSWLFDWELWDSTSHCRIFLYRSDIFGCPQLNCIETTHRTRICDFVFLSWFDHTYSFNWVVTTIQINDCPKNHHHHKLLCSFMNFEMQLQKIRLNRYTVLFRLRGIYNNKNAQIHWCENLWSHVIKFINILQTVKSNHMTIL